MTRDIYYAIHNIYKGSYITYIESFSSLRDAATGAPSTAGRCRTFAQGRTWRKGDGEGGWGKARSVASHEEVSWILFCWLFNENMTMKIIVYNPSVTIVTSLKCLFVFPKIELCAKRLRVATDLPHSQFGRFVGRASNHTNFKGDSPASDGSTWLQSPAYLGLHFCLFCHAEKIALTMILKHTLSSQLLCQNESTNVLLFLFPVYHLWLGIILPRKL